MIKTSDINPAVPKYGADFCMTFGCKNPHPKPPRHPRRPPLERSPWADGSPESESKKKIAGQFFWTLRNSKFSRMKPKFGHLWDIDVDLDSHVSNGGTFPCRTTRTRLPSNWQVVQLKTWWFNQRKKSTECRNHLSPEIGTSAVHDWYGWK